MAKKNKEQRRLSKTYYNGRKWNTFKQQIKNGEPVFNKNGTPKMVFASIKDLGTGVKLFRHTDNGFVQIRSQKTEHKKPIEPATHEPISSQPTTTHIITQRKSKTLKQRMEEFVPTNEDMRTTARRDRDGNYRVDDPFEKVTHYIQGFSEDKQRNYYNLLYTANKVIQTVRNLTDADVGFFYSLSIPSNEEIRQRRETSALQTLGIEGLDEEKTNEYVQLLMGDDEKAKALILDIAELNLAETAKDFKQEFLKIYKDFLRDKNEIAELRKALKTVTPLEFYKIAHKAGYRQMRYYIESQVSQEDYENVLVDLHALIGDIYNKSDILDY